MDLEIFVVMEYRNQQILYGRYNVTEGPRDLRMMLAEMDQQGLRPTAVTTDGNPALIKLLREIWPEIIIQRCLFHIKKQGMSWCRRSPKTAMARQLKALFERVPYIRTSAQRDAFWETWDTWEFQYGPSLTNHPIKGWVMSDLVRARCMLKNARPDMFHFLDDPGMASTNNALEGYFSRFKEHYRHHRGLAIEQRSNYLQWYLYLFNKY
jgi:hypothetical protein